MENVTIGGERLGAGGKMKAKMHNFERSTHDLSYLWRSTMASGTLVPFLSELALPGDSFDINLNCDVLTHPTIGPLFGSYKVQLDVFAAPIRLYQALIHMNALNVGRSMKDVLLPQLRMHANGIDFTKPIDNQQINPSSIFSYLNMRGLGLDSTDFTLQVNRDFNAIPFIAYWEIYKQYYANKQEEIGAVIHQELGPVTITITSALCETDGFTNGWNFTPPVTYAAINTINTGTILIITGTGIPNNFDAANGIMVNLKIDGVPVKLKLGDLFDNITVTPTTSTILCTSPNFIIQNVNIEIGLIFANTYAPKPELDNEPQIVTFPLENIDKMRMALLQADTTSPYYIDGTADAPYGLPLMSLFDGLQMHYAKMYGQEGLGIKTYNSDLFNNWVSTEWIDGPDGISEITAIDTSSGNFTLDVLNLKQKIYNMLNRIAISGGTYDDWQFAIYGQERKRAAENPMYMGGLIKELVFQEVVSNAAAENEPLGSLAGRGKLSGKHKGGNIEIRVDEPTYIIGIVSLTPRVDYSQGNKWDVNLETWDDFHKPGLDEIGFQDLITDQMTWFDTRMNPLGKVFKSAGKQPAWINYMTNVNQVRGNFADMDQQMYMVLNRRYEYEKLSDTQIGIKDLTTYIDPSKFNHIFADTRRDAQNFWTQIAVNMTARRKMSAKIIPNL